MFLSKVLNNSRTFTSLDVVKIVSCILHNIRKDTILRNEYGIGNNINDDDFKDYNLKIIVDLETKLNVNLKNEYGSYG
jgi:hypothetical protein